MEEETINENNKVMDQELNELREKLERAEQKAIDNKEKEEIKKKLKQYEFSENHSGLLGITQGLQSGASKVIKATGDVLKATGKGLSKVAEVGNKMDENLAKNKNNQKKKTIDEAIHILD